MKKLIIATHNPGKVKEIKALFGDMDFVVLSLKDIGYREEIIEDRDTFLGNATKKADSIANTLGELTLADDSGLEVDILGGKPGVLSARFAGEGATDGANNQKLLNLMEDIPQNDRGAQFRCTMVLINPRGGSMVSEGICRGKIAFRSSGYGGFGYDPIFIPCGYDRTMAELSEQEKNRISHRAAALLMLKDQIHKHGLP